MSMFCEPSNEIIPLTQYEIILMLVSVWFSVWTIHSRGE